jgi:hypothetical protein
MPRLGAARYKYYVAFHSLTRETLDKIELTAFTCGSGKSQFSIPFLATV